MQFIAKINFHNKRYTVFIICNQGWLVISVVNLMTKGNYILYNNTELSKSGQSLSLHHGCTFNSLIILLQQMHDMCKNKTRVNCT